MSFVLYQVSISFLTTKSNPKHLDPSAMVPCIDDNIPVYVRNIFNPAFEGTVVQGRSPTLKDTQSSAKSVNWRAKKVRNVVEVMTC